MKCGAVRAFLSQINDREEPISPIPSADLDYLTTNGLVLLTSKEDHDKGTAEVARLSQMIADRDAKRTAESQAQLLVHADEQKEHSFMFHFEGKAKAELGEKLQGETSTLMEEESELAETEANVNGLIQEKSTIDRMVQYGSGYVSLTGVGTVILNDLSVRNYRVADEEFPDFLAEVKATYAELRSIADKASSYVGVVERLVPAFEPGGQDSIIGEEGQGTPRSVSPLWASAIGVAKLRGDPIEIGERFADALGMLIPAEPSNQNMPGRLMAAEVITALEGQNVTTLYTTLAKIEMELSAHDSVPADLSPGIAAAIMAGRRYDGTFPFDRFRQAKQLTTSFEAASILAVLNVDFQGMSSKFQQFRSTLTSWGYMSSLDTEIASAFLAIGELGADEVGEKMKYIVEQLKNYLEYPLVAAAILASIPVFEAHEVLDLMEKAVTLLSGYTRGLERSELVALAVRMIHGVRNELVKEIDSTAKITETPVQFTYPVHPGLFIWYHPVIIAHSYYHGTFGGMGGFHPAHSHGIGGFAG